MGVASVGAIAGAMLAPTLRRRIGLLGCVVGATVAEGVAIAAGASSLGVTSIAALALAYVFGERLRGTVLVSLRQETVPLPLLARVTAIYWGVIGACAPLGAALGAAVAARFGVPPVLLGIGISCIALGILALATPIARGAMVSQGTLFSERETGFEPATSSLGS